MRNQLCSFRIMGDSGSIMKKIASILTVSVFLSFASSVYSAEKKAAPKAKSAPAATATEAPAEAAAAEPATETAADATDNFRCEKMRDAKLADLKEKMVTYCNLKLPFSIAGGDFALNSSYTYCCTKK